MSRLLSNYKRGRRKTREYLGRKIDVVAEKIDESKEYLGKKIDDPRVDLRSY